ncbi:hypothetical protein ACFO3K_02550 [Cellulomonas algicola]|uniref:hypothetical protein n=1 Tax=Cellulomonas algicola TaxID=2071633 RepID=UPI001C3F8414|nr:hypothetical protein [Cellulomonas algicola]
MNAHLTALPAEGYTELAGWPVEVLDELHHLADECRDGRITYPDWISADQALRTAAQRPPAQEDVIEALEVALHQIDDVDVLLSPYGRTLRNHFSALTPPPTTEQLRAEIVELDRRVSDWQNERGRPYLEQRLKLVLRWLDEAGEPEGEVVELDQTSGLPIQTVRDQLVEDDPVIGPIPRTWAEARSVAWKNASDAERTIAQPYRGYFGDAVAEIAKLRREATFSLVRAAFEVGGDDPGSAALRQLWSSGALRGLVGYVMREEEPTTVVHRIRPRLGG